MPCGKIFLYAVSGQFKACRDALASELRAIGCEWLWKRIRPRSLWFMTWLSHCEMVHLAERCIEAPDYHFAILYGISKNTRAKWHNDKVAHIGYRPQDDAEQYAEEILTRGVSEDPLAKQFHGGFYVPMDFTGDASKVP